MRHAPLLVSLCGGLQRETAGFVNVPSNDQYTAGFLHRYRDTVMRSNIVPHPGSVTILFKVHKK